MFFLSKIIILSLPFTNLFAIGTFATISFLGSQLYLFLYILKNKKIIKNYILSIFFLLILLGFTSIVVYLLYYGNIHSYFYKAFRAFVFIFLYIVSISLIFKKYGVNHVLKYLYYATWIVLVYGLLDFLLSNFIGIHFDNYLYRYNAEVNHGSVGNIIRLRSTFSEPGYLAFYINTIFPITLIYLKFIRKKINYLYFFLGIIVFILTVSSAGFAIFSINIILLSLLFKKYKILLLATILFSGIFILSNTILSNTILVKKITKRITLNENVISVNERLNKYIIANEEFENNFNNIGDYLFGKSPGYIISNHNSGLGNFFLNTFIEHGIIGIVIIIVLFYKVFTTILKSNAKWKLYCFYVLFSIILHLLIVQIFYNLFIYFGLLSIYYLSKITKDHETLKENFTLINIVKSNIH
jgi:hypothetical protein